MVVRPFAALVALALIAGCSDAPADADNALAEAAAQVEVEATSTTGVIRGVVVDDAIRPLSGVLVVLTATGQNATTNEAGAFGFEGLEAGTHFLTAGRDGYTTVQQSVEVVAGVGDPEATRIMLAAIPRGIPSIESLTSVIFVSGSGWVAGVGGVTVGGAGVLGDGGNWNFQVDISPNGTVAQTELVWDMTTPLGAEGRASGGTYAGDDGIDTDTVTGPSPLVMRANATEEGGTADNVYYSFYAWPSGGLPAGLQFNQKVDAYVNVFHNFLPDEGWTFYADGAHQLPP